MYKFVLLFIATTLLACQPDLDYKISGYTQKIIVEGTIANGEYPRVYLTLNTPAWQKVDSVSILENVIRYAKVTVSDGETTEVLTSGWEITHFPPFVYVGTDLKGEEGKTYTLRVDYGGYTITSTTTIPRSTPIDSFIVRPVEQNDTLCKLFFDVNFNPANRTGFRIYTKKLHKDRDFRETRIVFNEKFALSGKYTYQITPVPVAADIKSFEEGRNFRKGDTVLVRFCAIDSVSTLFFKDLTDFSTEGSGFGSSINISEKKPLKSNVTYPGFGIWWGAGVRTYRVVI